MTVNRDDEDRSSQASPDAPLVSVGMPVYNAERWLRTAIESILNQHYSNLELVISDNASRDYTESICREFVRSDNRVRYYRNPQNLGVDANYNRVVDLATGSYFKWASSNDVCRPEFLGSCISILEKRSDVVLCCPRTQLIVDDANTLESYRYDFALEDERPSVRFQRCLRETRLNNALNGVVRTAVLRQTGLLRQHLHSDVNLIAALSLYGKIALQDERLFLRRMTPGSTMGADQVVDYYSPKGNPLLFQSWKIVGSYLDAVRRAPLPLREEAALLLYCAKCVWWQRGALARDVWNSLRGISPNA